MVIALCVSYAPVIELALSLYNIYSDLLASRINEYKRWFAAGRIVVRVLLIDGCGAWAQVGGRQPRGVGGAGNAGGLQPAGAAGPAPQSAVAPAHAQSRPATESHHAVSTPSVFLDFVSFFNYRKLEELNIQSQ